MSANDWLQVNQAVLAAELARVRGYLSAEWDGDKETRRQGDKETISSLIPHPSSLLDDGQLARLCAQFNLSQFERDVLLLCAGVVLDTAFADAVAAHESSGVPTFALALALLPEAHWSALLPEAPLRRWRLIEAHGANIARAALQIDERVLHHLVGLDYLDIRLRGLVHAVETPAILTQQQQTTARTLVESLAGFTQLNGGDVATRRAVAAYACEQLGTPLWQAQASDLPHLPADREAWARLWEREAALSGRVLLLECQQQGDAAVVNELQAPLIIGSAEPLILERSHTRLIVPTPTRSERRALWHTALGSRAAQLNGQLDSLTAQFQLSAGEIAGIAQTAEPAEIWNLCRASARARLDDLAQRITSAAGWDDLVLPEAHLATLRDIAAHARQRTRVYDDWGFGTKSGRGLGISALFAGPSGTGKTLAAEVLANAMQLDLYRIDLSQVVSKYIGETEKNLRRVFDAAEGSGAVLLFDEADALFGKRSEIKDSHDRYANIEVGYLLQRMESYGGLAILTTNMRAALDPAFLRRLRFVVDFPFPDAAQRAAIWRTMFPPVAPTEGLAFEKLARLHVAGGNIHNIALNAAFYAADAGQPLRMAHLLRAARAECAKIEKPLSESEVAGWV